MTCATSVVPLGQSSRRLVVLGILLGACSSGGSKDSTPTVPTPVLSTVTISLSLATIQVGQTSNASASGLDQNGASIALGAVVWSSNSTGVATVGASGVVSGVAPGQAQIIGTSGGKQGLQLITIIPIPVSSVTVAPAAQTLAIGATQQLSATTFDANNNVLTGRVVTWSTSDSTKVTVSGAGLATAIAAGSATITATSEGKTGSAVITVSLPPVATVAVAPAVDNMGVGGTQQLTATLHDASGNVLTGRVIVWTTSDATKVSASTSGLLTAVAVGSATITATSEGKTGTATITVAASGIAVTSITPALLTPGIVATVNGSGFSPTASANALTIEGVAATVLTATASQLTFAVPLQLPCRPIHQTTVRVTALGSSAQGTSSLRVGALKTLAVGGSFVLTSSADLYCTELPAGTSGYTLTLFSIAQSPTATFPFRLRGDTASVAGAVATRGRLSSVFSATRVQAPSFGSSPTVSAVPKFSESGHARVMAANEALYPAARNAFRARMAVGAAVRNRLPSSPSRTAIPSVGSTKKFRVDQFTVSVNGGGNCTSFIEITARLVYAGSKSLVYEDAAAPLAGTMDSYFVQMGQEFDATMYHSDSTYFGDPLATDAFTDADQHLSMVFTPRMPNLVAGFVTSCDFFQRDSTSNTTSNFGELFYGVVPTVAGTGFSSDTPNEWMRTMRTTVVHEVKHIASFGARLINNAPRFEESWLEEGMARMAEEMWLRNNSYHSSWKGDATYANTLFCDVRPSTPVCSGAPFGMFNHYSTLWQVLTAPSSYSMFGRVNDSDFRFYAETWSFVRWALDRYGAGEAVFLRGITQAQTSGLTTLAALTGHGADEMYGLWSLSQVWDDNSTFLANSDLQFPTWNTPNIYAGMTADFPSSFTPVPSFLAWTFTNSSFTHDNSRVVGGGFDLYQISGTTSGGQTIGLVGYGGIGSASSTLRIAISRTR
jgi:uncharacterized protein YjdB